jgi:hypothetical protein
MHNFFKLELPKKASFEWCKYWLYVKEVMPKGEVAML